MGGFPSETVGDRELGGTVSSHREGRVHWTTGLTALSARLKRKGVCAPVHTGALWCLSQAESFPASNLHSHPWEGGLMIPTSKVGRGGLLKHIFRRVGGVEEHLGSRVFVSARTTVTKSPEAELC